VFSDRIVNTMLDQRRIANEVCRSSATTTGCMYRLLRRRKQRPRSRSLLIPILSRRTSSDSPAASSLYVISISNASYPYYWPAYYSYSSYPTLLYGLRIGISRRRDGAVVFCGRRSLYCSLLLLRLSGNFVRDTSLIQHRVNYPIPKHPGPSGKTMSFGPKL